MSQVYADQLTDFKQGENVQEQVQGLALVKELISGAGNVDE